MSLPLREASLEEGPVLRLIRDYFEQAGHAESLLSLEHCCKDYDAEDKEGLPLELSALREMALMGRWDQVIKYLTAFSGSNDQRGLQRCMYIAQRQKYLEILDYVEDNIRSKFRLGFNVPGSRGTVSPSEAERTHEVIEHQLATLEPLCPSRSDYQSLRNLLSLPSVSLSKEFSDWQLHSGRLETFYEIGEWVSKVLYLSVKFPMCRRNKDDRENKNLCALLRLVAKGLLYEQCEQLCRARCGETEKERLATLKMLDLSGWIQQQPDSSFQLAPTEICFVVKPLSKSASSETQIFHSMDMGRTRKDKGMLKGYLEATDRSVSTLPSLHLSSGGNRKEKGMLTGGTSPQKVGVYLKTNSEVESSKTLDKISVNDVVGVMSKEPIPPMKPNASEGQPKQVQEVSPCASASYVASKSSELVPASSKSFQLVPASSKRTSDHGVLVKPRTCDSGVGDERQDSVLQPSSLMASEGTHLPCITPLSKAHLGRDSSTPRDCKTSRASLKTSPPSSPILFAPPATSHMLATTMHTTSSGPAKPSNMPISATGSFTPGPSHQSTTSQGFPQISAVPHAQSHTSILQLPPTSIAPSLSVGHNITSSTAPGPVGLSTSVHGLVPDSSIMLQEGGHGARNRVELTSKSLCWPSVTLLGTISDSQVVRSVAFSGSGKIVAVGANSRTLRLCYTPTLLEKEVSAAEMDVFYQHPHYHKSSIYCMSWLHDSVLASGSNDQTIRLLTCYQDHKFKVQKPLLLHKGTIRDLVFTQEGLLVSGGGGSTHVKVTDVKTCQNILSLSGHTDHILALGVLPGGLVVSGGQDSLVLMWDLRTHLPITSISLGSPVTSLSVCSEGLVTARTDGSCSIHELKSYQCTATYAPHVGECRTVRLCPDRSRMSWVLSGSYDGTVCLAEVTAAMAAATERVQWTKLCQHRDKVIQCRWHPDGHMFASTGADKKACFWRLR